MREMVLDVVQRRSKSVAREHGREAFWKLFAGAPGSYPFKYKPKARAGGREIAELARQMCRAVLIDRDMVDITEAQIRIRAGNTRSLARETRPNA